MNPWGLYWLIGSFGLLFGLLAAFRWWWNLRVRTPIREKLLRPPGESLRRELESIDDRITTWVAAYALAASFILVLPSIAARAPQRFLVPSIVLALLGLAAVRLVVLLKQRRNYALGFSGERLVGEELGRLAADGFHVFHDIPTDSMGNIDHVVVSDSGIFAVETKTRRKGRAERQRKDHVVVFDGHALQFPHCIDERGVEQAKRNADWLASYLNKATGEPVRVEAVLTLPGWFVERRGKGAVRVLNHKELRTGLTGETKLTPEQIRRVVHQLDQRCRDVEF